MHDLAHPEAPRSALGLLAAAIHNRRANGTPPFTILCCDNLPANGRTVHRLLTRFATLRDPDLGAYVEAELACPDTMVDRIVPATTDADRARVAAALGLEDAWPVVTEPFTQWVIEDPFRPAAPTGTPPSCRCRPVRSDEAAHVERQPLALAYLGYLAGAETVADAMRLPALAAFAASVMEEAVITLPPGLDTAAYQRSLLQRFENPALRHRTWQIAMDGTQKLPQRILATMADRLRRGLPIDTQAMVVAAWMRFVTGRDEHDRPIDVRDPMAPELARIATDAGPVPQRLAPALLAIDAVFGELGRDDRVRAAVTDALTRLYALGAVRATSPATISRPR